MAGPPGGFEGFLQQKYDIMRDEANARNNLLGAQASSIAPTTASEIALRNATAAETQARTGTVDPLAQASIAATRAGIGETQARTGLTNSQTQVSNLGFTPVFGDNDKGYSTTPGGPQTPNRQTGVSPTPSAAGGLPPGATSAGGVISPTTAQVMHQVMTGGGTQVGGNTGVGSTPFAPAAFTNTGKFSFSGGVTPDAPDPGASSYGPVKKEPWMWATGTAKVPGKAPAKGSTDTVPAMLTPGEAVINKEGAQMMGRDKIAKVNQAGLAARRGMSAAPQKLAKGTHMVMPGKSAKTPPKGLAAALATMQAMQQAPQAGGASGALPSPPGPMGVAPGLGIR